MGINIASRIVTLIMAPFRRVAIDWIIRQTLEQHSDDVIRLNQQQLAAGLTSEGTPIVPFYKPVTIAVKVKRGQPTDRVTLHDSGDFYKGMFVKNGEVSSTDPVTEHLVKKYTLTIFGLSEASKSQLVQIMQPTLQQAFRTALLR